MLLNIRNIKEICTFSIASTLSTTTRQNPCTITAWGNSSTAMPHNSIIEKVDALTLNTSSSMNVGAFSMMFHSAILNNTLIPFSFTTSKYQPAQSTAGSTSQRSGLFIVKSSLTQQTFDAQIDVSAASITTWPVLKQPADVFYQLSTGQLLNFK